MSVAEVKLGELGELRNGLNYSKANAGTGLKVISVKNFGDLRTPNYSELDEINPDGINAKDSLLKAGDVIFVRSNGNKDLIGRSMFIEEDQTDVSFSGFCIRFRNTSNRARSKYLAYFFRSPVFRRTLSNLGGGVNINNLNQKVLANFPIPLPELDAQDHILSVISAYDDLIENNRRRIALLEQAARLLYREWFVHFRFPGHETATFVDGLPEGWVQTTLGEHCPFVYGKALKADARVEGDVDVYGSSGIVGSHNKLLVEGKSIVVGRKGNVGSVFWAGRDFWPIDTVYYISPANSDYFTFYALKNVSFISTDVAVPGLNRDFAHSRKLIIPDQDLLDEFNTKASTFLRQSELLIDQNTKLTVARDLLLPRLMDGRLPVDV
ncbi:restriction endonuclease subunit S [uncultured Roseobacter sp.]|uniref:restriction endonuclease subunit S n=1 Tax=uncultured Roseobacter sp. TaxID=114847 RepID=UPI002636F718|nr:restriction endonuclease subunit S [uncultured Roseobacter sp.]